MTLYPNNILPHLSCAYTKLEQTETFHTQNIPSKLGTLCHLYEGDKICTPL